MDRKFNLLVYLLFFLFIFIPASELHCASKEVIGNTKTLKTKTVDKEKVAKAKKSLPRTIVCHKCNKYLKAFLNFKTFDQAAAVFHAARFTKFEIQQLTNSLKDKKYIAKIRLLSKKPKIDAEKFVISLQNWSVAKNRFKKNKNAKTDESQKRKNLKIYTNNREAEVSATDRIKKLIAARKAGTVSTGPFNPKPDKIAKPEGQTVKGELHRKPNAPVVYPNQSSYNITIESPGPSAVYRHGGILDVRYTIDEAVTEPGEVIISVVDTEDYWNKVVVLRQVNYFSPASDGSAVTQQASLLISPLIPAKTYEFRIDMYDDRYYTGDYFAKQNIHISTPEPDRDMARKGFDIQILSPNGGPLNLCSGDGFNVTWQMHGDLPENYNVDFLLKQGETTAARWRNINGSPQGDGMFTATLEMPEGVLPGNHYFLKAQVAYEDPESSLSGWFSGPTDRSDSLIRFTSGISLLGIGGGTHIATKRANLRWRTTCPVEKVNIYLMRGSTPVYTIARNLDTPSDTGGVQSYLGYLWGANTVQPGTGEPVYDYTLVETIGEGFRIKVENADDSNIVGISEAFTVKKPIIYVRVRNMENESDRMQVSIAWEAPDVNPTLRLYATARATNANLGASADCNYYTQTFELGRGLPSYYSMVWTPQRDERRCLPWLMKYFVKIEGWERVHRQF